MAVSGSGRQSSNFRWAAVLALGSVLPACGGEAPLEPVSFVCGAVFELGYSTSVAYDFEDQGSVGASHWFYFAEQLDAPGTGLGVEAAARCGGSQALVFRSEAQAFAGLGNWSVVTSGLDTTGFEGIALWLREARSNRKVTLGYSTRNDGDTCGTVSGDPGFVSPDGSVDTGNAVAAEPCPSYERRGVVNAGVEYASHELADDTRPRIDEASARSPC